MYSMYTYTGMLMKKEKVEVVVKTSSGVELKIESDRQTVQEIVSEIHRREESKARFREEFLKRRTTEDKKFQEMMKRRNKIMHSRLKNEISKVGTKKSIFLELIKNKFFVEPKGIGDIQKALQEKGYHYPTTSLSPTLLRFVRSGMLKRSRNEKGLWTYISGD